MLSLVKFPADGFAENQDLAGYGMAHNTTLLVENLFNVARRTGKKNPRGRLEPKGAWHAVAMADSCILDWDRPNLPLGNAKAASAGSLPKNMFNPPKGGATLSEEQLSSLMEESPSWANLSPARHKEAALCSLVTTSLDGKWSELRQVWQSLLLLPGSYVRCDSDKRSRLVLAVSPHGFLGFRCGCKKTRTGGVLLDVGAISEKCIVWDYVTDHTRWKAVDTQPVLADGHLRLELQPQTRAGILQFSMRRGMPNFTVFFLKRLHKELKVPVPDRAPMTEAGLLRALAAHVFPQEYSEPFMEQIVERRNAALADTPELELSSPLRSGDVEQVLQAEIEDMELEREIQEFKQRQERQKAKLTAAKLAMAQETRRSAQLLASGNSSSSSNKRRRKLIPFPATGFDQASARAFLPPGASVAKEQEWHCRWRITARGVGSKSKTFAQGNAAEDNKPGPSSS